MNKIYLFLCVLLAAGVTACYEDKGNYDYHPVNEIQVSKIEKEYAREKWQLLSIQPELKFSLQQTDEMAYRWEVNGRLVSEEKDLNYDVDVDVADDPYKCRFTAIHLADSSRYYQEFQLKVITPFEEGLMVLSEQEGKAMLSFRPEHSEDGEFLKWVYLNENGTNLEGKPLSLEQPEWLHDNQVFVATSRANYKLDKKILKLVKRYDGSTMLEKDPDFEIKFCKFTDMVENEDFGCAIGTNGRVYTYREYTDYFSTPSPRPIPTNADLEVMVDYDLSEKCLISTAGWGGSVRRFLGYDSRKGQFLQFSNKFNLTIDDEQLNSVTVRTPLIGMPLLAIGSWSYNKFASFFYDPQTNVAKVVALHNSTFSKVEDKALITLPDHDFTPSTILKFSDTDGRAVFSSGHLIRQIHLEDVTAPSTVLSDKLPEGAEITCLKFSSDRKRLYVGVLSNRSDEYKGDLYVLDAINGNLIGEPYLGVGGKLIDVIEKW